MCLRLPEHKNSRVVRLKVGHRRFNRETARQRTPVTVSDLPHKRLNEMDDLRDMGHFPPSVHAGATSNVLLTILMTYLLKGRHGGPLTLPARAGGVICTNVLPVILLRSRIDESTHYPEITRMSFFGDQHKFASWVYAVASANMLVWIVLLEPLFAPARPKDTQRNADPRLRVHLLAGLDEAVSPLAG